MNQTYSTLELQQLALDYRETIIRLAHQETFGIHIGGSLSLAEVFIALYFGVANVDPKNPDWQDRDRVVLSKGHGNVGLLVTLGMLGFFPMSELNNFNRIGSKFSMHADAAVPGVEHSAGSLGHGLSVGVGMALAGALDQAPWRVYVILGDGESMEGSVWEAMMSAAHYSLGNLTAVIDRNRLSQEGTTEDTMQLEPLREKCEAFGWETLEINGHDMQAVLDAFRAPRTGKPRMIIANTHKGRGVPAYENKLGSHFAHLTAAEMEAALAIVEQEREALLNGGPHG